MSLFKVFDVSGSAMTAQSVRLNVTASNLANADSVASTADAAYRARHPVFAAQLEELTANPELDGAGVGVRIAGVVQSAAEPVKRFHPEHPLADAQGFVYGSNVNPVEELTNMISASRSFQASVEVMSSARDLLLKTISMGR
ncbi:MAG: flagellar basal body rod protein FlgC [Steroidobacteraceae bacterium]|jgi:flagellar basal-body rod protein FlgC|nr:flagellar basal body rod protein FlgC [Steroidobacteraceae bacterium]